MHIGQKILENLAEKMELPGDVVAGLPKVELVGFSQLLIESHKGVLRYDRDTISVSVSMGVIHILGEGLSIQLMNQQNLRIGGKISTVQLEAHHGSMA